jgi:hypothetical protein
LLGAVPAGCIDHVRLDKKVIPDEISRIGIVGEDPPDLCSREEYNIGALSFEEGIDGVLPTEIELAAGTHEKAMVPVPRQAPDEG